MFVRPYVTRLAFFLSILMNIYWKMFYNYENEEWMKELSSEEIHVWYVKLVFNCIMFKITFRGQYHIGLPSR